MLDIFITIDTECSLGGALDDPRKLPVQPERAILGRIGSDCYGTPLVMSILERNGLRGTFFLEVLASHVTDAQQMADAYGQIIARGHDAQLHLHPVYHYYRGMREGGLQPDQFPPNIDLIGGLPVETQLQLLREGCALLEKFTGNKPVAFRAGCFGASNSTLRMLAQVGIQYDSSFNASYLGQTCLLEPRTQPNLAYEVNGVWEVPITNFAIGMGPLRGLKHLDIVAVSWPEMKRVLLAAERMELGTVVFLLHSFSFLKRKDIQFRALRPDRLVIRRFEALCRYLGANTHRFQVRTFRERPKLSSRSAGGGVPHLGTIRPLCRKFVQAMNRPYWV